jgi:uncharacterized protein YgiM (DUF1202 family)
MPDQPVPSQVKVVSDRRATEEIENDLDENENDLDENVLDARRKLQEEMEKLKKQRAEAKARWTQALAIGLTEAPLSVDGAIERYYKPWNAEDEPLKAKFAAAEGLSAMIEDVAKTQESRKRPQTTIGEGERDRGRKK